MFSICIVLQIKQNADYIVMGIFDKFSTLKKIKGIIKKTISTLINNRHRNQLRP